jgi:hypothetical protein
MMFNPWTAPSLDGVSPSFASAPDGSAYYFAENRAYGSYIIGADGAGEIRSLRRPGAVTGGRVSFIADIIWWDGGVWFVLDTGDPAAAVLDDREIRRMDALTGVVETVFTRVTGGAGHSVRLSAEGEHLYMTLLSEDGAEASAYELPCSRNDESGEFSASAPELILAASAGDGERILSAVSDGRYLYCAVSDGNVRAFSAGGSKVMSANAMPRGLSSVDGGLFFADASSNTVYFDREGFSYQRELPAETGNVTASAALNDMSFAVLTARTDGRTYLTEYDGADFGAPISLTFNPAANMKISLSAASTPGGAAVAALACLVFLFGACLFSGTVVFRIITLQCILVLLAVSAVVGTGHITGQNAAVGSTPDAAAFTVPPGVEEYGAQLESLLADAAVIHEFRSLLAVCAIAGLCALLLCVCLTALWMRPLLRLPKQMSDITANRIWNGQNFAFGEAGRIQKAVQEVCMSLSIREYEMMVAMKNYRRFMPQDLDMLLDRANLMEIEYGDTAQGEGDIGLVTTVMNGSKRLGADERRFLDFVFAAFHGIYAAANGSAVFLSAGFSLTDFRLLFRGGSADGVRTGIRLATDETAAPPGVPRPEFLLILHRANYEYGVTGKDAQAVTFMSSYELGLLAKFSVRLSALGVKLIVTEKCVKTLADTVSTRYIGYVASSDEQHNIKLYEVLDVYRESTKDIRKKYNDKFQEAIGLYYKNDFYLARNIFSEIFKNCSDDGVAKQYIFACERLFNRTDFHAINYSIFGADR